MSYLNIPEAAYTAGESAITGYPIAAGDLYDVASDAINAAAPIILTTKLEEIISQLTEPRTVTLRDYGNGVGRSAIGAVIGIIRGEIEPLKTTTT